MKFRRPEKSSAVASIAADIIDEPVGYPSSHQATILSRPRISNYFAPYLTDWPSARYYVDTSSLVHLLLFAGRRWLI